MKEDIVRMNKNRFVDLLTGLLISPDKDLILDSSEKCK